MQCPCYHDNLLTWSEGWGFLSDLVLCPPHAISSPLAFLIYPVSAHIQMMQDEYFASVPFPFFQFLLKNNPLVNLSLLPWTFYHVALISAFSSYTQSIECLFHMIALKVLKEPSVYNFFPACYSSHETILVSLLLLSSLHHFHRQMSTGWKACRLSWRQMNSSCSATMSYSGHFHNDILICPINWRFLIKW